MNKEKKIEFSKKGKTIFTVAVSSVLALGFIGSIVGVILTSPELKGDDEETNTGTKGLIRLNKAEYQSDYFSGEHFSFDKTKSSVTLVAKDPSIDSTVKIDDLPAPEYGFVVGKTVDENGNVVDETDVAVQNVENIGEDTSSSEVKHTYTTTYSDFYLEANEIVMSKNMGTIYLVSKKYQDLRYALTTNVLGEFDTSKMTNSLLLEAEEADLYKDGTLLSEEQKIAKPYYANVDPKKVSDADAANLSGGNCLRNFSSDNMKVDFVIPSNKATTATLDIKYCMRPNSDVFSNFFKVKVNGESYEEIDAQTTGQGASGTYYTPATLASVSVDLNYGINHITFESGSNLGTLTPVNLDAIEVTATDNCLSYLKDLKK